MLWCLIEYPVIEITLVGIATILLIKSWSSKNKLSDEEEKAIKKPEERSLAASVLKDTVSTSLTAMSIILAAVSLVISLKDSSLPCAAKIHFRYIAFYGLLSIVTAAFNMGNFPPVVITKNIAYLWFPNVLAAGQFLFMSFAAGRLFFAIYSVLS